MNDPVQDLAALVADVRAVLAAERLRGVRGEAVGSELPAAVAPPVELPPSREAPVGPDVGAWHSLAARSRASADAPDTLDRIRAELGDCQRCKLAGGRTTIVFGVGSPTADLVVVGEGPGYHEDQQGEPFVGAAGQMLDKMLLNVIGLSRAEVYILNVVKCRPPNNRNPLPDEVDACMPFLRRQIAAIEPKVLLVLGSVALRSVFGTNDGITRARGRWRTFGAIPAMPTFHPAYLLRNPAGKRPTFEDLKAVRARYDELGGTR